MKTELCYVISHDMAAGNTTVTVEILFKNKLHRGTALLTLLAILCMYAILCELFSPDCGTKRHFFCKKFYSHCMNTSQRKMLSSFLKALYAYRIMYKKNFALFLLFLLYSHIFSYILIYSSPLRLLISIFFFTGF